jgi:BirA family biotin operon repressor/biotin-[acetyl-CoA-carboxylase] ligase
VLFAEEVDSTNDRALALAAAGRPEGTSVLAELQRAGRGRRGRAWFSPPAAGLYLSVIVRPKMDGAALPLVTIATGVALAEAVAATTRLPVELKWPNDLVIGRPWRKLAGVLAEAVTTGARIDAVVIGIGVNVTLASYPRDIAHRTTSLEGELGHRVDRASVLVALLERMREIMTSVHANDRPAICEAWRRFGRASLERQPVRWHDASGERRGVARDIDADGALLVDCGGRVERVIAGDVVWETLARE